MQQTKTFSNFIKFTANSSESRPMQRTLNKMRLHKLPPHSRRLNTKNCSVQKSLVKMFCANAKSCISASPACQKAS